MWTFFFTNLEAGDFVELVIPVKPGGQVRVWPRGCTSGPLTKLAYGCVCVRGAVGGGDAGRDEGHGPDLLLCTGPCVHEVYVWLVHHTPHAWSCPAVGKDPMSLECDGPLAFLVW
jgi:hypothetical protein